ncbi:hypothetical protein [Actinoallomurus iriomotensis]|uniref:Uncharacterized protein n=1 Tax=Actinoallomurus iriomotensis TaxID=478107 RepID=A0A9W6RFJ9_9ACTN|nr:hypothetical protein [Actinoallomurus iriomotensis]GLY74654.1 hypothetical protein Airi01_029210 [Actinoallomurus iriomotensis]
MPQGPPPGPPGAYQGPPGPPGFPGPQAPWAGPGAPPYGMPPRRNKRARIIVAVAAPVVILLLIVVANLLPNTSAPTGEWKAGQCVSPAGQVGDQEGKAFHRVGCDASDAAAKITKMTSAGLTGLEPTDCPDDTDAMVKVDQSGGHLDLTHNVACIRNIKAPHPGDVGQGGGLFRAGDCISDPAASSSLKEVPCAQSHWGTVVRWADSASACPQGADYDAVRTLGGSRALCVRRASGQTS